MAHVAKRLMTILILMNGDLRTHMLITAFADKKMSSQLTNLVSIFDGTNYQQWTAAMQSFLMSQGQWKYVKDGADVPTEIKVEGSVTNAADIASYLEDAEKVIGNICLHLHHTIGYQFNSEENPAALWQMLKKKYGVPGISGAFKEFKGIMDIQIPNNSDPSPAIDKIMAHVRATLPYCSQRDSASCLASLVPLVTSGRLILDC